MKIDFNRPAIVGKELEYIKDAVDQGMLCGDGKYTKLCSSWMKERFHVNQVFLTTSCTHALEMAAYLCDIHPGDEVIMPSYTFVSTADAFVLRGAKIVFVDIRPDTMNIDEKLIEQAVTKKNKGDRSCTLRRRGLRDGYDHGDCPEVRSESGGRRGAGSGSLLSRKSAGNHRGFRMLQLP